MRLAAVAPDGVGSTGRGDPVARPGRAERRAAVAMPVAAAVSEAAAVARVTPCGSTPALVLAPVLALAAVRATARGERFRSGGGGDAGRRGFDDTRTTPAGVVVTRTRRTRSSPGRGAGVLPALACAMRSRAVAVEPTPEGCRRDAGPRSDVLGPLVLGPLVLVALDAAPRRERDDPVGRSGDEPNLIASAWSSACSWARWSPSSSL